MAGWGAMKKNSQQQKKPNLKGFDEDEDLMMKMMLMSQKPGIDLLQNCDLPPPMKVFSGSDNKTVISSMNKRKPCSLNLVGTNQYQDDVDNDNDKDEDRDGKMGLLRALRLSQTRAREAEAKCAAISKERDSLVVGYMEDSMQVFAYRQLVRLLELQVSNLQKQKQGLSDCEERVKGDDDDDDDGSGSNGLTWIMALAFCFGIAGFGFALGCKYYSF